MLNEINRNRGKFYLANAVTLGIYGAIYVVVQARSIGKIVGSDLPSPGRGLLLTLLTLGIYPGIMLCMLAYKLAPRVYSSLGYTVLALNLASLITALLSGGFLMIISIALWAHAVWLVADAADILSIEGAPNKSSQPTPHRGG